MENPCTGHLTKPLYEFIMQQEKNLRPSPEFSIAMVRYPNEILTLIFELLTVNYITVIQVCMFIYKNTQGGDKVGSCGGWCLVLPRNDG